MSLVSDKALEAAKDQYERARKDPSPTRAQLAIAAALIAIAEELKAGRTA